MAEPEELSEDSLFDNAVEGVDGIASASQTKAPEAASVEQPPAETAEAAPETAEEKSAVDDDAPQVPSWRVREINEEKRAAQAERDALKVERDRLAYEQQEFRRRLAQLEQPKQPKVPEMPDPLLDPAGHAEFLEKRWEERERRFEERLVNERREMSLQVARKTYKDEFDEAYQTAQQHVDPILRTRMQQSSDPGETLISWYRERKILAEIGSDPKAYDQKKREQFLNDPEFLSLAVKKAREQASGIGLNGRPNVRLGPSLNGVSRSSAAVRASQEDFSDDALWEKTTT